MQGAVLVWGFGIASRSKQACCTWDDGSRDQKYIHIYIYIHMYIYIYYVYTRIYIYIYIVALFMHIHASFRVEVTYE